MLIFIVLVLGGFLHVAEQPVCNSGLVQTVDARCARPDVQVRRD